MFNILHSWWDDGWQVCGLISNQSAGWARHRRARAQGPEWDSSHNVIFMTNIAEIETCDDDNQSLLLQDLFLVWQIILRLFMLRLEASSQWDKKQALNIWHQLNEVGGGGEHDKYSWALLYDCPCYNLGTNFVYAQNFPATFASVDKICLTSKPSLHPRFFFRTT